MGGEHNLKSNNWNINLNKTVYNNKEFDDVVDRDFSQLIKTKKPINVERLFTLYRELFYKIQKYKPKEII